ncbi:MAG: hypothetical protein LBC74_06055 [Planctomycetaceae bacterium]|nr:hypothetical protein [Planctomycetaceae bacterium]
MSFNNSRISVDPINPDPPVINIRFINYWLNYKFGFLSCSQDLFSNLKIHQRNKKTPLTPPRPPLTPPKEGSGVVSYRLAKRSTL